MLLLDACHSGAPCGPDGDGGSSWHPIRGPISPGWSTEIDEEARHLIGVPGVIFTETESDV